MGKTRFMTVLFSASENGDEELTNQIAGDIQSAKENGSYEDENGEMSYVDLGDKGVLATDKGTGEYTLIHENPIQVGDDVVIDLEEIPDYCVEDLVHPEVSENEGSMVYNPMSEKEFSVSTDNSAVLKIFSDQEMVETVTESVYNSEQEAQVGDLKFEKDSDTDGVIVTDMSTGDKAKVELEGEDMKVTELDQKNFKYFSNNKSNMEVIRRKVFSHAEQYEPIFVVAIDPINKVLVNSPVYGEEMANDLAQKLMERGLEGVNIFADPDEGREYALALLCGEGAEEVGDEEEMEVAYSDNTVIANRYFSDRTRFMNRLFSEAEDEVADHQELVESAIEDGEQMETEDFIITPVDDSTAVVEDKDNGEYTVAEVDGEDINVEEISEDEAMEMMQDVEVEEKEYSDDEESEEEEEAPSKKRKLLKKAAIGTGIAGAGAAAGIGTGYGADKLARMGKLSENGKFYKAIGKVAGDGKTASKLARLGGAGALTALGTAGMAYGGKKAYDAIKAKRAAKRAAMEEALEEEKEYSSLYQVEYADSDKKPGMMKRGWNKVKDAGSKLVTKVTDKGVKMSNSDKKVIKKAGEFMAKHPKSAMAIAATATTATAAGMAYGGKKAYDAIKAKRAAKEAEEMEKEYSDVDEATLAQIEDSSIEAIQNVQEAAETAIQAINEAKEAPVEEMPEIKEATYSDAYVEAVQGAMEATQKLYAEVSGAGLNNPSLSDIEW